MGIFQVLDLWSLWLAAAIFQSLYKGSLSGTLSQSREAVAPLCYVINCAFLSKYEVHKCEVLFQEINVLLSTYMAIPKPLYGRSSYKSPFAISSAVGCYPFGSGPLVEVMEKRGRANRSIVSPDLWWIQCFI